MAWMRETMSRRSPSSRSASFQKMEEKFALFRLMFHAQDRPFQIKSAYETYISRQRFISSAETFQKNST